MVVSRYRGARGRRLGPGLSVPFALPLRCIRMLRTVLSLRRHVKYIDTYSDALGLYGPDSLPTNLIRRSPGLLSQYSPVIQAVVSRAACRAAFVWSRLRVRNGTNAGLSLNTRGTSGG